MLAIVFAASGSAKLRQPQAFAVTAAELVGSESLLVRLSAPLVCLIELACGAMLLSVGPTLLIGVSVSLALLTLFTALVAFNLWAGRRVRCACFGSNTSAPIGLDTLMRNVGLLTAATWLLWFALTESDDVAFAIWEHRFWSLASSVALLLAVCVISSYVSVAGLIRGRVAPLTAGRRAP
jgi:hypothetical protein